MYDQNVGFRPKCVIWNKMCFVTKMWVLGKMCYLKQNVFYDQNVGFKQKMLMQYWFPFRGCSPFWLYSWLENWDSWTLVGLNAMFKRRIKKKKNSFLFCFVFLRVEIRKEGKSFAFLLFFWFCSSRVFSFFGLLSVSFFFAKRKNPFLKPKILFFL